MFACVFLFLLNQNEFNTNLTLKIIIIETQFFKISILRALLLRNKAETRLNGKLYEDVSSEYWVGI